MRRFEKCPRCEELRLQPCECKRYEIGRSWNDEAPESWETYHGDDPEVLVEKWADEYDSGGDYTIVGGRDVTVWVRDEAGSVTKWEVSGEAEPVYYAHQISEPTPDSAEGKP